MLVSGRVPPTWMDRMYSLIFPPKKIFGSTRMSQEVRING